MTERHLTDSELALLRERLDGMANAEPEAQPPTERVLRGLLSMYDAVRRERDNAQDEWARLFMKSVERGEVEAERGEYSPLREAMARIKQQTQENARATVRAHIDGLTDAQKETMREAMMVEIGFIYEDDPKTVEWEYEVRAVNAVLAALRETVG